MTRVADGMAVTSQDYAPALPEAIGATSPRASDRRATAGPRRGRRASRARGRACRRALRRQGHGPRRARQTRRPVLQAACWSRCRRRPDARRTRADRARLAALGVTIVARRRGLGRVRAARARGNRVRCGHDVRAGTARARHRRVRARRSGAGLDIARLHDDGRRADVAARVWRCAGPARARRGQRAPEFPVGGRACGGRRRVVAVVEAGRRPSPSRFLDLRSRSVGSARPDQARARLCRSHSPRATCRSTTRARSWQRKGRRASKSARSKRIDGLRPARPPVSTRFEVDTVCAGYGFLPSNEIARALGCRHRGRRQGRLSTVVDDDGLTSVAGVYAIGDTVALRGAHAAQAQGFLTGCAVARSLGLALPPRSRARARSEPGDELARHLAFQRALWSAVRGARRCNASSAGATRSCAAART